MRKKSILRRLIPWLIVLLALAALVVFVFVPIYSREERSFGRPTSVFYYDGSVKDLKMENSDLAFEMDPDTTQFTVTDKETGRIWRSNPEDAASDAIALSQNKDMLFATLLVTYFVDRTIDPNYGKKTNN